MTIGNFATMTVEVAADDCTNALFERMALAVDATTDNRQHSSRSSTAATALAARVRDGKAFCMPVLIVYPGDGSLRDLGGVLGSSGDPAAEPLALVSESRGALLLAFAGASDLFKQAVSPKQVVRSRNTQQLLKADAQLGRAYVGLLQALTLEDRLWLQTDQVQTGARLTGARRAAPPRKCFFLLRHLARAHPGLAACGMPLEGLRVACHAMRHVACARSCLTHRPLPSRAGSQARRRTWCPCLMCCSR